MPDDWFRLSLKPDSPEGQRPDFGGLYNEIDFSASVPGPGEPGDVLARVYGTSQTLQKLADYSGAQRIGRVPVSDLNSRHSTSRTVSGWKDCYKAL